MQNTEDNAWSSINIIEYCHIIMTISIINIITTLLYRVLYILELYLNLLIIIEFTPI